MMAFAYADILHRQRPAHDGDGFSRLHPRMPRAKRAKIFAPYAALKGYDEAVAAKNVPYAPRHTLDEDEAQALNERLQLLRERCGSGALARENRCEAAVDYFVPCADRMHAGYGRLGQYARAAGVVWQVDMDGQTLLVGETRIAFADIWRIRLADEAPAGAIWVS